MRWRLTLVVLLSLAGCSDSGDDFNTVPSLAWGTFRHDASNSGSGNAVDRNEARVRLLYPLAEGASLSSPTIDNDGNVFLGTPSGVISVDRRGRLRWSATECTLESGTTIIGPVSSSPTVSPGKDVVFSSDAGQVFALRERRGGVECLWAFSLAGTGAFVSSPQVQVDSLDLSILAVFVGAGDGVLQAINGTGTARWSYPAGAPLAGAITSTAAVNVNGGFYVTTPDGLLVAIDASGRPLWSVAIGTPPSGTLQPSPAANVSVYAVGANSALYAITPDGRFKWPQFQPNAPVPGSPTWTQETIDDGADLEVDTVVYIVDEEGTIYAVRDQNGQLIPIQRCSEDTDRTCRTDSCLPDEGTCVNERCTLSGESCFRDTCEINNVGTCESRPGTTPASSTGSVPVTTSPALSADLLVVIGTADGRICARAVDGTIPGDDDDAMNPWATGCVPLAEDALPVRSSPTIGPNGVIHVTTDAGLYIIE